MNRPTITLKAKPAFKRSYQSLLNKDWDSGTMRGVLNLLDAQPRASGVRLRWFTDPEQAGLQLFAGDPAGTRPERSGEISIGPRQLDDLLQVFELVGSPQLSALPVTGAELVRNARNKTAGMALRASTYLAFQALFNLQGETGFFRDVQSLLYLHVTDWLLPDVRAAGFVPEHRLLVDAMGYHFTTVWRDNPAHQQYLVSVLASYVGDQELEESALLASFRLTDPEDHDYLTVAQCYWSFLLENHRPKDAETFLLGVYRRAPRESLAEIQEMLDETFAQHAPLAT